ncbi:MAG: tyrosine-type recombinase/integrase [Gammaproteobacteria bacterium]
MVSTRRLSKSVIDRIPPQAQGQQLYRDGQLKGFAVRVTPGTKTFVVEKRINRKVRRIKLGCYGEITCEQARRQAQHLLGRIAVGMDPLAEREESRARAVTLQEVFDAYLGARKSLKPKTLYDYHRVLRVAFKAWRPKPMCDITKDAVAKRHMAIAEVHGEAYANLSMRLLRALFNFAAGQYEDNQGRSFIGENPVKRLSQTRAWYRIPRRQSVIKPHELASWYRAVIALKSGTARDYLLVMLFTGLRRQEAARLTWDRVDLKGRTLIVTDTKNSEPHILPLSDCLYELLARRQTSQASPFVFPGPGAGGYIADPRAQIAEVVKSSGVSFTIHDLRRSFTTIAESLDISMLTVKRLLNHRLNDVTAGYAVIDVERLRRPMQKITDYLRRCAEGSTEVYDLKHQA